MWIQGLLSRSADHDDLSQNQWDIKHGFALLNIRVREETLVDIGDDPGADSGCKIHHRVAMLTRAMPRYRQTGRQRVQNRIEGDGAINLQFIVAINGYIRACSEKEEKPRSLMMCSVE